MLEDRPDAAPDTRLLLLRLQELLENARAMPLSWPGSERSCWVRSPFRNDRSGS